MGVMVFWFGPFKEDLCFCFFLDKRIKYLLSSSLSAQTHPPNPVSSLKTNKILFFCTDEPLCSRKHTGQKQTGGRMEINPTKTSHPPPKISFITALASLFYWFGILQGRRVVNTHCLSFCEVSTSLVSRPVAPLGASKSNQECCMNDPLSLSY